MAGTDIEQRLRKLEDEKAILDTLYAYGHHLDAGLEDAWIDCWTEDAVLGVGRGDFTPKETSDGTELTLPIAATHRHLGAIAAVVALLLGAGGVVLFAKGRGASSTDTPPLASVGAAASQAPSAMALPPAAIASDPDVAMLKPSGSSSDSP